MALVNQLQLFAPMASGLVLGCIILLTLVWFDKSSRKPHDSLPEPGADEDDGPNIAFLFEGSRLLQASEPAMQLIQPTLSDETEDPAYAEEDWNRMLSALQERFPDLPDHPSQFRTLHGANGQITLAGSAHADNGEKIHVEWWGEQLRLQVFMPVPGPGPDMPRADHGDEVCWLRMAVTGAPYPIWQTDPDGRVLWANTAYDNLVTRFKHDSNEGALPDEAPPGLFDIPLQTECDSSSFRLSLVPSGSVQPYWFDVRSTRISSGWMNYATDVNAVVNAEIAQRNFVQTLTKTFAQLSIGLAIFDRKRQLALFNPALIDLTSLPADFLSAKPNLLSFFDRLRDHQMMPEPKNYRSWRDQIADLVAAADNGLYMETWSLPTGLTYRISGRPHPDGAVAFLFEDISAEISLTRQFRSQLELGQSALNTMEQSIAVFSSNGILAFANTAYCKLWHIDPDSGFSEMSVIDASRHWQSQSVPTPVWGDLRDFVNQYGERSDWQAEVSLRDGKRISCNVVPMPGGATMVQFQQCDACPTSQTKELSPVST